MELLRSWGAMCVIALCAACASTTPINLDNARLGMSREEVIATFGQPTGAEIVESGEVLYYEKPSRDGAKALQCMGAGFSGQAYLHPECQRTDYDLYLFLIQDSKLVKYKYVPPDVDPVAEPAYYPPTPAAHPAAPSQPPERMLMCPDGSYVYGSRCQMAPNGSFVGVP